MSFTFHIPEAKYDDVRGCGYIYMLMIHVNYVVIRRIDYFGNFH